MALDFGEMRRAMVDSQVRTTDVTDIVLLDAMMDVPRETFVPTKARPFAYIDEDIALNEGEAITRYMMEPSPFARLVQLADVQPNDLVLDVGCGTGYSSAILSRLAGAVIALESDTDLADRANTILGGHGFDSVAVVTGPLEAGLGDEGPYDVILIAGAVDFVPDALLDQLKPGGRLVAVLGQGPAGFAHLYVRDDEGILASRQVFNVSAKPLPGFAQTPQFVF